jgi:hypothetical protein
MTNIKTYLTEKSTSFENLDKAIRENVNYKDLNLQQFNWNVGENLEYHTARHEGNLTKENDSELIFNTLINHFINRVYKINNINDGKMLLHRAIELESIDSLNENLGIYWSFDKNNTFVFDDEDYDHGKNNKKNYKRFEFSSEILIKDIDWSETFDLYIIQEFGESEIRLKKSATFNNTIYKESSEKEYKKLGDKNLDLKDKLSQEGFDTENVWYHVTNAEFDEFDIDKTNDGCIWLTRDYDSIINGETGASISDANINIYEFYLKINKLGGWEEEDKYFTEQLIQEGYDGVLLDEDIKIFNPENAIKINKKENKPKLSRNSKKLKGL